MVSFAKFFEIVGFKDVASFRCCRFWEKLNMYEPILLSRVGSLTWLASPTDASLVHVGGSANALKEDLAHQSRKYDIIQN